VLPCAPYRAPFDGARAYIDFRSPLSYGPLARLHVP